MKQSRPSRRRWVTCIHEAGHAVVGHAIGLRIGSNGITTVTSKKTGNAGATWFLGTSCKNELVETLAGPLAEGLAAAGDTLDTSDIGHGWGKDEDDIVWTLRAMKDADSSPRIPLETLRADVSQIVIVFAIHGGVDGDTEFALEELGDDTPSPHALVLAKAADIALEVLDKRWETVIALADHLMTTRKMSGEQLVTFLAETNAAEAKTRTHERGADAQHLAVGE